MKKSFPRFSADPESQLPFYPFTSFVFRYFFRKKPVETEAFCLLPAEKIAMCEAAAFTRVHCKDNEKHVWLLQGWKKARYFQPYPKMKKNTTKKLWKLQQDLT